MIDGELNELLGEMYEELSPALHQLFMCETALTRLRDSKKAK